MFCLENQITEHNLDKGTQLIFSDKSTIYHTTSNLIHVTQDNYDCNSTVRWQFLSKAGVDSKNFFLPMKHMQHLLKMIFCDL